MSARLIICTRCGCTIQRNTPLEHGGSLLPAFDRCDDCTRAAHELQVLSLGEFPAAMCSCALWGFTATQARGETEASKRAMLVEAHREHVEETK